MRRAHRPQWGRSRRFQCFRGDRGRRAHFAELHRTAVLRNPIILSSGGKFGDLAKREKLHRSYFSQLLRLAYLAPDITTAILDGHQPAGLTATQLIERADLPMSWREQRRTLGFA